MHFVPRTRLTAPAVAGQLERGVRRRCALGACTPVARRIVMGSVGSPCHQITSLQFQASILLSCCRPLLFLAVNVSDPAQVRSKYPNLWRFVICIAVLQNATAVFAVYSSSQDVLSDGACLGGIFGTLFNFVILAVVLTGAIVLAAKSLKEKNWHAGFYPLVAVGLSSTTAILIGQHAALRCTV